MSNEIIDAVDTAEVMDPNTVYAKLVKREDGYHIIDFDGTEGPVCNISKEDDRGNKWVIFTPNKSNRKYIVLSKAEAFFAENPDGAIDLYYKATKTIGSAGPRIPNEKLISYLPDAEQEEYRAIIARAIAAKEADKKQPKTELEKAQDKLARAKAAYEKLLADASATDATDAE